MHKTWRILEPIQIGRVFCRNRIVMAAHSPGYVNEDALPTDHLVAYLAERAKGGIGLVIMGGTSISREGALVERIVMNVSDEIVPWYQKIANEIHKHGANVFEQLMHVGGQLDAFEGSRIVAPSAIPHEICNGIPVELGTSEIKRIVHDFATATRRARQGELDGVEIKCDQGFLIHQFLSPYYNRRTDAYGGTYEKRCRFLLEVLEAVRKEAGDALVVGVRIAGDAMTPGDLSLDDAIRLAGDIETTGWVDYVHVNAATNSTYPAYLLGHGDATVPHTNFASIARAIKRESSLPILAASMVTHPGEAEQLITSNIADMVAMTRGHIADAEIVNKVRGGSVDDIRPCVYCNQGCVGNHWKGADVRCIHNPATGRERELGIGTISRSQHPKRIAVIGGGPAGLETARVAALRGHKVELFEKEKSLGGQVQLAWKLPYKSGLLDIIHYLERQIKKLGVRVWCGVQVDANDLASASSDYDVVVLATGAEPYIPPIYQDVEPTCALNVKDVLEERATLGEHVLIVSIDWRQNGLGIAEWLVRRGCKVTLTARGFFVGEGLDVVTLTSTYSRIQKHVDFFPLTNLESLENKVARLRHVLSHNIIEIHPVDQVIFVTGAKPLTDLYFKVENELDNVLRVGDCVTPRGIPEAMLEGNRIARIL